MRILLGVQGTGNGHISRSRELIKHLVNHVDVDVLLSGIHHEVDLGFQANYRLDGLGFIFGKRGGIDYWKSIKSFSPYRLISDIYKLPIDKYDLVLTDFEPITAWAAKAKGMPSLAISHQAAFLSTKIPRPTNVNHFQELIIKWYAPGSRSIGLHFERYDGFIHKPIIREEIRNAPVRNNGHYTVYLPSYDERFLCSLLKNVDVRWEVFSKHHKQEPYSEDNVTVCPVGNREFVRSLSTCEGILCNAGFETPSEAIYMRKKLMVIPMKRQYEQECNAEALKRLGVPVVRKIGGDFVEILSKWVESSFIYKADYGNNIDDIVEDILYSLR